MKLSTPGLHANLNHALRLGTSPFVAICQDDDYWLPNNLEKLTSAFEQSTDIGLAHGAFDIVEGEGRVLREQAAWRGWQENTVESGRYFHPAIDIHRQRDQYVVGRVPAISGGVGLVSVEDDVLCDTGMWMRLAKSWAVAFVGETLSALRVHPGAVSVATGINDAFGPPCMRSNLPSRSRNLSSPSPGLVVRSSRSYVVWHATGTT